MRIFKVVISTVLVAGMAACSQTDSSEFAMRNSDVGISDQIVMQEQVTALRKMTDDIVRKSTASGAAFGAMAGCGLVVLSASNAKNCVAAAAVGAAGGAIAGHVSGQRQVAHRIKLVNPNTLVKPIGASTDQIAQIEMSLPSLLASQDIELADLSQQMKHGEITESTFASRVADIRANRAELAQALALTGAQASTAYENLKVAQSRGQTGLDWHITATRALMEDVMSARETIDLL